MTKTYKQLTMDERTFIQLGLMVALKPAQIALELSRSTSTITRELKRNGWIRPVKRRGRGGGLRSVAPGQGARTAGDKSLKWSISETGRQRLKRDGSQDTGGGKET